MGYKQGHCLWEVLWAFDWISCVCVWAVVFVSWMQFFLRW
jgi:hypothetical protein